MARELVNSNMAGLGLLNWESPRKNSSEGISDTFHPFLEVSLSTLGFWDFWGISPAQDAIVES